MDDSKVIEAIRGHVAGKDLGTLQGFQVHQDLFPVVSRPQFERCWNAVRNPPEVTNEDHGQPVATVTGSEAGGTASSATEGEAPSSSVAADGPAAQA
jgi:hypothetical protein